MDPTESPQNLVFISALDHGPVWWMICDDNEIMRLAKKWIEAYPNIAASTDVHSIFPNATLSGPENASPEFWKTPETYRVWHAVVRDRHPEWTFPAAGPHFHVTDHPGRPSQDDDGPIEYGCIPCLDEDDEPQGDDVDDRWVHGFSPGTFCSAHWAEWLAKNPIAESNSR